MDRESGMETSGAFLIDGKYRLADLVDIGRLSQMFDLFSRTTGFAVGLLSHPEGSTLIKSGWHHICLDLHQSCPESRNVCRESTRNLTSRLNQPKEFVVETCARDMVNGAIPLFIGNMHVADLVAGQALLDEPDVERFRSQAVSCGHEPEEYLKALKEIPVVPAEVLHSALVFLGEMADLIGEMGLRRIEALENAEVLKEERDNLRRTQEKLRTSEERFRRLAEKARDMIYRMTLPEGRYEYVSPAALDVTGYAPEEFYASPLLIKNVIHPDWRDYLEQQWEKLLKGEPSPTYEYKILHKSGEERWLHQRNVLVRDEQGVPMALEGIVTDITERRRTEEALRKSSAYQKAILNNVPFLMWIKDRAGVFMAVNDAFAHSCGRNTAEEVIGKTDLDIWPRDLAESYRRDDGEVMDLARQKYIEEPVFDRGETKWFETFKTPILDADGKVLGTAGFAREITQRKTLQLELQRSEEKYRAIFEKATEGIFQNTPEGRFISVNPALARIFGFDSPREMMEGVKDIGEELYVNPGERRELIGQLLRQDYVEGRELNLLKRDGSSFWVILNIHSVRDSSGVLKYVEGTLQDITERKRMERDLQKSEERYRAIFENASEGIFQTSPEGRFINVNPAVARMMGYSSPGDLIDGVRDIAREIYVHPEERHAMVGQLEKDQTIVGREYEFYRRDGSRFWVSMNIHAVRNEEGAISYYEGMVSDITEMKLAQEELHRTYERLDLALKGADLGTWDWNIVTGETVFNERWAEMLGYRQEEIDPHVHTWENMVHPDDLPGVMKTLKAHLEGKTAYYETEHRLRTKQGAWKWILDKGKVTERDGLGKPLRAVGTHLDIDERVRAQEEREQLNRQIQLAQKAESLGRMAGAIAHHFNNQLTVVLGNLELIMVDLPRDHKLRKTVSLAMQGANRAAEVSRLMLTYLGQTPSRHVPVDLGRIITDTGLMITAALPEKVHLALDLPPEGPVILGDEGLIRQVLMNLATNAWEAIGEGPGEIKISLNIGDTCVIPPSCVFHLERRPDEVGYACVSVADTGCGIPSEVIAEVFDPFFSSKLPGRGLGLAVTAGIVRSHQGGICVESEPGRGSVFRVYFPLRSRAGEDENKPENL